MRRSKVDGEIREESVSPEKSGLICVFGGTPSFEALTFDFSKLILEKKEKRLYNMVKDICDERRDLWHLYLHLHIVIPFKRK